ncbi:hypothetical protein PR202_ga22628 [Eleusine coracana subsp. coracana]|uniref:Uncharacterized protein n=1 Tax=Eleusine coracana subsp. coracana TaxID=191504 RepID=A0AAV5D4G2_ELECO|nr:hypothetical protein PR202_ga22628 [Eleusine coracana subsp. coracana]
MGILDKNVCFGLVHDCVLRVWILSEESSGRIEWVLKYQHDLALYAQYTAYLDHTDGLVNGPWKVDGDTPINYDTDDDSVEPPEEEDTDDNDFIEPPEEEDTDDVDSIEPPEEEDIDDDSIEPLEEQDTDDDSIEPPEEEDFGQWDSDNDDVMTRTWTW